MEKKEYMEPEIELIEITYNTILCVSKIDKYGKEEDEEVDDVNDLL